MKKFIQLGLMIFVLFGCQKSDSLEKSIVVTNKGFNPKKENILPLIDAFKERVNDFATLNKTTILSNIELYEAEWTLEAALNHEYAHPVVTYDELFFDTIFHSIQISLMTNEGEVFLEEGSLITAYQLILNSIQSNLSEDNTVELLDVEISSINNQFVTFAIYITSGSSFTILPEVINTNDYWRAGMGLGKCNGTLAGLDATDRLEQIINHNIANNFIRNLANPQDVIFYTNIATLRNVSAPYAQTASDEIIISNWWGNMNAGANYYWTAALANNCLSPTDMQMFLDRAWSSIYATQAKLAMHGVPNLGINAANRDIISIDIANYFPFSTTPNVAAYHCVPRITYGVPVL